MFRAPWEAHAFAMALTLHERGVFTWPEWAAALASEIKRAQAAGDPDTGETYYLHWLATLEGLVARKGVASAETLHRYRDAWDHAADRTPHGKPIELRPEDFAVIALRVPGFRTYYPSLPAKAEQSSTPRPAISASLGLLRSQELFAGDDGACVRLTVPPRTPATPSPAGCTPGTRRSRIPSHAARRVRRDSRCATARG